jgi:hypothetical protein
MRHLTAFILLLRFAIRLLVVCLSLSAIQLAAEDSNGRYIVGGGVGSVYCSDFVSLRERSRNQWFGTVGYVNDVNGFVMYLAGFQTAYNHANSETCDIFDHLNQDQLLFLIEGYCRVHPIERFGTAIVALAIELHPIRLRDCVER